MALQRTKPRISTLSLRHVLPEPLALEQWAEIRPVIDGRDLLAAIHPDGVSSCSYDGWIGAVEDCPLAATKEARQVELSNNDCDTGCCGGVFVTVRRDGPFVLWTGWKNTNDIRVPSPPELRFDAAQYNAALTAAADDVGWEDPVHTAARLVARALGDGEWFERWGYRLAMVRPYRTKFPADRESPSVSVLFSPIDSRCTYYSLGFAVTGNEAAEDQARQFVTRILADDPRKSATLCGT
ncbi:MULTISPECIES: hypothetical protein [unclassified Streptomyces]|uniref:hypothetical protein n=1 Tax=unclassified Streptomyces TaxID=2593676 RepID=UPI0029BAD80F|nr:MULTISPECIES: hypothetical protein [unclassified Streptomyces]MDX3766281.1 hypothetical protein [Streptomyces sp. AK08-01B]MDX3816463.1 hypothetical protein [Streptomyces sp. AK08-01A]